MIYTANTPDDGARMVVVVVVTVILAAAATAVVIRRRALLPIRQRRPVRHQDGRREMGRRVQCAQQHRGGIVLPPAPSAATALALML